MNYYQMTYVEEVDYECFGVAYAQEGTDLFLLPLSGNRGKSWKVIELHLKEGTYADYLTNNLGARLCSVDLYEIIEKYKSPEDDLQWLETQVWGGDLKKRTYYILHFPTNYFVVNGERSMIFNDVVVQPVFQREKVCHHEIFTLPDEAGRRMFVSEDMKRHIETKKITGVQFVKIETG